MTDKLIRKHDGAFHWEGVDVLAYKQDGSAPFKDVTRQVLFDDPSMATQLRYFEVAPGGWTTLERHEHVHNVMVIRGRGRCLVGEKAWDIAQNDLVAELHLLGCINMTREILANIEIQRSPATCKQIEFFAEVFGVMEQELFPKKRHFVGKEVGMELRIFTRRRRSSPPHQN